MLTAIIAIIVGWKLLVWGLDRADRSKMSYSERRLERKMEKDLNRQWWEAWNRADYETKVKMREDRRKSRIDRW
jgi:hypothetical protein